jgi:hypothetical protein
MGPTCFHPHDDHDHYDLGLLRNPEFGRAILLDLGERQQLKPGRIPLEQMFRLSGRSRAAARAGVGFAR